MIIVALGTPAGQGNIRYNRTGHGYHSNGKTLRPWRAAIKQAAAEVCKQPITGPVSVEVTITVPTTKRAAKQIITHGRAWPDTRYSSDVDHHARAILDSLTGVAFEDDSAVVELTARKVYTGCHVDALDQPGAVITVRSINEGDA